MTHTRVQEFAETWNGGDAGRVASTFAEDGVIHASVGAEPFGASVVSGRRSSAGRGLLRAVSCGRFETLRVTVAGDLGTLP